MKKAELLARIEALEARVAQLEAAKSQLQVVHYQTPSIPAFVAPLYSPPSYNPPWTITCTGIDSAQGTGLASFS